MDAEPALEKEFFFPESGNTNAEIFTGNTFNT